MSAPNLDAAAERVANRIRRQFSHFRDYAVRADAGGDGMVYVALRQARRDVAAGERLADQLTPVISETLDAEPDRLDFAISLGSGDEDLLLLVEIRASEG